MDRIHIASDKSFMLAGMKLKGNNMENDEQERVKCKQKVLPYEWKGYQRNGLYNYVVITRTRSQRLLLHRKN